MPQPIQGAPNQTRGERGNYYRYFAISLYFIPVEWTLAAIPGTEEENKTENGPRFVANENNAAIYIQKTELEPEPDRIWILNRSHITGSGLPDSVDPAQYPDINPDIRL